MTTANYLGFGALLLVAILLDMGLISRRETIVTTRKAFFQTLLWVCLSLVCWGFLWFEKGASIATKYISAYLMEWSLSIDNVFVFIVLFGFFKVPEADRPRALLIGILLAIVLRIGFIAAGIELIYRFHWLLYLFGAFLVFTGLRMFFSREESDYDPSESKAYLFFRSFLPLSPHPAQGKYILKRNPAAGRSGVQVTTLFLLVLMLAVTDIVFALDSIPTVVTLVRESASRPFTPDEVFVIYASNIFAVLGLRSLFFLLRNAMDRFRYLGQGIAAVLMLIGIKMLLELFGVVISIYISLAMILLCLAAAVALSLARPEKRS